MQVQESQRVPNKMDAKRPTPTHIIIKMLKFKNEEINLKAAREKQLVTYKGVLIRRSADSQKKLCRLEGSGKGYYYITVSKDKRQKLVSHKPEK